MKTLRLLLPGLLLAVLLFSAFRPANTRETRRVEAFTAVSLGGSMRVIVRQGSPQLVEVEGDAEDLARLETTVSGGKLRIGTKPQNGMRWSNFKGSVTVYVTMPIVTGLAVGGSGSLKAADGIRADNLDLAVSGSGGIDLASVTADKIHSAISGSGSIQMAGVAPRQEVAVSGSGGLRAEKLQTKTCSVRISGSGNCRVQATETLDARIAGSGGVFVSGNPRINSSIAGSGRVHRI
ncbi:head GIN domain-containing protein [Hymenobacter rubripertinctus]|uniref:DUF2807 domain-containing protein n=1 Tax=Hymenobacter rubripertinctus TaxID=2029981 RepID=A0A418QXU5_9BACT|nr:head GIN domain-containing protein [Hymenobacter rubripertinctus]RIY09993.1 DUF2807 domain-containing protein [Hymenobacter rubripertinctus]